MEIKRILPQLPVQQAPETEKKQAQTATGLGSVQDEIVSIEGNFFDNIGAFDDAAQASDSTSEKGAEQKSAATSLQNQIQTLIEKFTPSALSEGAVEDFFPKDVEQLIVSVLQEVSASAAQDLADLANQIKETNHKKELVREVLSETKDKFSSLLSGNDGDIKEMTNDFQIVTAKFSQSESRLLEVLQSAKDRITNKLSELANKGDNANAKIAFELQKAAEEAAKAETARSEIYKKFSDALRSLISKL